MCWVLLAFSYDVFNIRMLCNGSSTASGNISLNSGSECKLTQLIVEDDRK